MFHFHRGERRYQRRRLFQKRLSENLHHCNLVKDYQVFPLPTIRREVTTDDWGYRNAVLRTRTGRLCSCMLCRSPRKCYGNAVYARTFQELRFIERFNDVE